MNYSFDSLVDRSATHSMKWEKYAGRDILPFWVADMDFAMAPEIVNALSRRLESPIVGYGVAPRSLEEAVMAHLKREFDWTIEREWLVWLPGVVPGMNAAVRAWVQPGHAAIVNPPIYHHFFDVHDPRQQSLVRVPLRRNNSAQWRLDVDATVAAMNDQTDLLLLCSPHNPVGTVHTADELRALVQAAVANDVLVLSDEIHCDLVLNDGVKHIPTAVACSEHRDHIITLMSVSKTFNLAGLNCSWAIISNESVREHFRSVVNTQMAYAPPLALVAAEAALNDGQHWREALLKYLRGNLELIRATLEPVAELELQPLDATYLAWIDATALAMDSPAVFFEQHGVGLSPGEQFGQAGYVRLNFACPRSLLQQGLERIVAAVLNR